MPTDPVVGIAIETLPQQQLAALSEGVYFGLAGDQQLALETLSPAVSECENVQQIGSAQLQFSGSASRF
eukprot:CAMPEP_0196759978 /NCGR_PEP_ID=MMETSP1091-20130531/104979_1 /TAXON_ID=302021 /ORGANISM="Rhodomonas sp., Strain CCMP768" /LENGTH=68 /DNA_ID=CAMNT_0042108843 /DNA_START=435 /DNA_END=641 /DNA_ORIENTATION=-